ncbi:MAG: T9SS type A sorting domain-containing protein [Bacteroidia bacterium]|nr:T9SS type A sorting domain-containing protein [Bacteroidia bacterium]
MKRILLSIITILLICLASKAQNTTCPEQGIRTDPNNPYETRTTPVDPNGTVIYLNNGKFDWRQNYYAWWQQVSPSVWLSSQINSPYTTINNPNLQNYISVLPPDNKPEDGWELISFHFGKFYNGSFVQEDHPRFILYNRYTGVLRVFFYYNLSVANGTYEMARIRLSFKDNNPGYKQSALLSHSERTVEPLDQFAKRLGFANVHNETNHNTGQWIVADFPMAYDPCTCINEYSQLEITVDLVMTSTVSITGRIVTSDNLHVTNKAKSSNFPTNYHGTLASRITQGGLEIISEGQKTFGDFNKFINDLNTIMGTEKQSKAKDGMTTELATIPPLPTVGFLPELESVKRLIEFFVAGGRYSSSNGSGLTPITFEADVNLEGTIINDVQGTYQYLTVPGSIRPAGSLDDDQPMYNEVLGVFSLLETPELEFVDYLRSPFTCLQSTTSPPAVRHFKVKKPIQFAVNPAAHLEIEKFEATFTINYDADEIYGNLPRVDFFNDAPHSYSIPLGFTTPRYFPRPYEEPVQGQNLASLTYEERLNRIGMGIETWNDDFPNSGAAILNTTWLPVGAIQDQSFILYRDAYWDLLNAFPCNDGLGRFGDPEIKFKIRIVFKRTDDPNAEKVVLISTYKVKFTPHPLLLSNPGAFTFLPLLQLNEEPPLFIANPGPTYFTSVNNLVPSGMEYLNFYRIPVDLELENTPVGPGTVQAINSIKIGNNVTVAPGTIFNASKQITVDPVNNIDPTVVMQLQYPTANAALNPESIKTTDFSSICNNLNKYNPIVPEAETAPPMPQEKANATTQPNDFAIYPNPASHQAKIVYSIAKDAHAKITVTDAMGKEVFILVNGFHTQGQYIQSIDASLLPPGIFFCRLERNGEVTIKKFTIIK